MTVALIAAIQQAHSDWLFQQVTHPYTSARVHLYVPGLLYSAAVPLTGGEDRPGRPRQGGVRERAVA
jgi:hypothetical protein